MQTKSAKAKKEELPVWFQAVKTFSKNGAWFFGSRNGLHIGPYGDRNVAAEKGIRVGAHLLRLKSDRERLRYVREVLRDEWTAIKKSPQPKPTNSNPAPSLQPVRKGEQSKTWFRTGRFSESQGVWFFDTREGIEIGPFETRMEAIRHERRLVAILAQAKTEQEAYHAIYEYKHRPTAYRRAS
jgi:hypothetical protein